MIPVGHIIADRRKQLGYNQQTLAAMVGMSQGTISKIETGSISPTVDQLFLFAEALNTPPSDFFVKDPYRSSTDWFGIETLRQLKQLNLQGNYSEMRRIISNVKNAPFFKTKRNKLELLYWKAQTANALSHHQDAISLCNQFFAENPNYADTSLTIKYRIVAGHALRCVQAHVASREHLEMAAHLLQSHPEIVDVELVKYLLYNLGCTYGACGDIRKGMETFIRLKALHDEDKVNRLLQSGETLSKLAELFELQGMFDQALEHYQQARCEYEALGRRDLINTIDNRIAEARLCFDTRKDDNQSITLRSTYGVK